LFKKPLWNQSETWFSGLARVKVAHAAPTQAGLDSSDSAKLVTMQFIIVMIFFLQKIFFSLKISALSLIHNIKKLMPK
jgi:hypothetical protein